MPEFSIIVNCLNGKKFLSRALNSIYNQTLIDWEVIFFDNNSTDQSSEIAKSYGTKLKYYKSDITTSLGEARNTATSLAKGNYIAFLDVDDMWEKTKLEVQLQQFETTVGFVYTNTLITDEKENSFELFKYNQPKKGRVFNELLKSDFIPTSSIAIKRDAMLAMNERYDNKLTLECDRDFILRLSNNFDCNYTNLCLTKRYIHGHNTIYLEKDSSFFELRYLKDKISKIEVNSSYASKSMPIFIANIDEKIARSYWDRGEFKKARAIFKKHKIYKKQRLLYYLTFLLPRRVSMVKVSSLIRSIRNYFSS